MRRRPRPSRARAGRRLVGHLAARAAGFATVLWAVATLTFFAIRLIPGDPALAILGGPGSEAGPAALAHVQAQYGLDKPLLVQYLDQLGRYLTGNLGTSYSLHEPVAQVIGSQLGGTLTLAVASLAVGWAIAVTAASAAVWGGRVGNACASGLEIAAAAMPHFWLGTVLILAFSTALGWLPAVSVPGPVGLILPVTTLAVPLAGFLGQIMRESLTAAAAAPFALSARARGESELGVLLRHTLRHAAVPAVALTGWAFGSLISGAVVVETIFARPGLGRTLLGAVQQRDVPLVTGVVLAVALAYCIATVAGEAGERLLDRRSRPGGPEGGR
ncbi:MAG TPA: ABC transporter permease [Microbacteriaceae bacterium]|nr:ABC transporter permease [Microbacteriaceae bacterium]